MASADEQLPEGTDSIIEGAGVGDDAGDNVLISDSSTATLEPPVIEAAKSDTPPPSERGAFFDKIDELRGQASDRARDLAQAGKDRAGSALDNLAQMVEDAASEIDAKLGSQYGDYARRAAEGIGSFNDSFRDKDVDDLFADARDLVKRSPAVAIGAAAVVGFVVARLARSGLPDSTGNDASKA